MIRNLKTVRSAGHFLLLTGILGSGTAVCQVQSDEDIDPWAYRLAYKTAPMSEATAAKYREKYHEVLGALESSEWRVALRRADRLVHDLRDSISDSSRSLAARVLVLRAFANAALDNERDALWDYDVAVAFVPEVEQAALPAYPPATARLLELISKREPCAAASDSLTSIGERKSERLADGMTATEALPETRKVPKYPRGMRNLNLRGAVVVRACIDRRGFVTRPEVLVSMPMPFMLSAFEALGAWQFQPGMVDGEPFATQYTATLNFNIVP